MPYLLPQSTIPFLQNARQHYVRMRTHATKPALSLNTGFKVIHDALLVKSFSRVQKYFIIFIYTPLMFESSDCGDSSWMVSAGPHDKSRLEPRDKRPPSIPRQNRRAPNRTASNTRQDTLAENCRARFSREGHRIERHLPHGWIH